MCQNAFAAGAPPLKELPALPHRAVVKGEGTNIGSNRPPNRLDICCHEMRFDSRSRKCIECVCGRGSAPDPAGGAYSAPPDPLSD